jgi:hypothetical protein
MHRLCVEKREIKVMAKNIFLVIKNGPNSLLYASPEARPKDAHAWEALSELTRAIF